MPFIKRGSPPPLDEVKPSAPSESQFAALSSESADARWSAARTLGGVASAVPALAAALHDEQDQRVREALMTALMRVGDEASVRALLPYLRAQNAAQRSAAIEALQALPGAMSPFMATLLNDADTDVRILATELARNMPAGEATRVLCGLLEREMHPNVCGAAIEVLAEVGTREAVPVLEVCAERFRDTPFLPFAISTTIARLSSTQGS